MTCELLEELRDQVQSVVSPLDEVGPSREVFIANYVDAYLACNTDYLANAESDPEGGPYWAANDILNELGLDANPSTDLFKHIENQVRQQAEGKRANSSTDSKDNTADFGADPVMLFKGQFVHEVDDIHINGAGIDFMFKRTYKNQVIFNGPLGYNWTHNLHIWLRVTDQVVFRASGDLREEPFARHPRFGETINGDFDYWIPPDGSHGVIFAGLNSFTLRQPNGLRQIFEPDPAHSFLYRLARVEDRFGNYLDLNYSDDILAQIEVNHPQRLVAFEYDNLNRICLIRDYTGREWCYTYDSLGDLIAVTSPKTDRYKCGLTVRYDYSSAFYTGELQHNLIRIIDAAAQIYLENDYGTSGGLLNFNRVVRQRQGGGEYRFEYENIDQVFDFDYPDEQRPAHQTIQVERNGQPERHIYNKFGNLLLREQCIIENGLPRTLTEHYRYNRDGSMVTSLSAEGVLTQYLYGRDYFVRRNPLTPEGNVPTDPLTWRERQTFGRTLATVRRGGYATFDSFTLTQGVWGDFPDILNGPFPLTIPDRSRDIIVKMTYEDEFGQPLTVSDPRFTSSANPDELNENPRYDETLTRYTYVGPARLLVEIRHPQPTLPNGTPGTQVVERFVKPDPDNPGIEIPGYDDNGRRERVINAIGVVIEHTYFDNPSDVSLGHLQQTVVDADGLAIKTRYEVDTLGRVSAVHLPKSTGDGRYVNRSIYNELDQLVETTSSAPFNFQTRRFYDRNGKLEREESDLRDENNQPVLGGSTVTTFCYDQEFNLIESSVGGLDLVSHLVTKYRYDNTGKRILTIFPNENQMRVCYDERQLPVAQTFGAGSDDAAVTRTEYDGDSRVLRKFDARGNPMTYKFDVFGRMIIEEDALGNITRIDYDKSGNKTCVRNFEKRDDGYYLLSRSETDYDELNRAIRQSANRFPDPIGPFPLANLDNAELESPGPGDLLSTITFYDAQGRAESVRDPRDRETTYKYDGLDRVTRVTDPLGNEIRNQYDAHSNLIRVDRRDRVLAENGNEIGLRFFANSSTYDELDRLTSSTNSLGNITQFFYDSRGNVVRQVDPLGNEQHAIFDIFNRKTSTTRILTETGLGPITPNAVLVTMQQEYDLNGNVIAVIDALNRRTRYVFDALDRRRIAIYPDGSEMLTEYDMDSNVVRTRDNNGLQRFNTVDELGRTTRIDVNTDGLPANLEIAGATFEHYEYDGLDRQTLAENDYAISRFHYNSLNWLIEESIQFTLNEAPIQTPLSLSREFDDVGVLAGLTYPNGRQLQLDRDDLNRLVRVQNIANGNAYPGDSAAPDNRLIARMTYAGRQRDGCIFGNDASTTYRHDGAARTIEIAHASQISPLLTIQYLFDAASNVRMRNDVLPNGSRTEHFAYDSLYRLVHEYPQTAETFNLTNFGPVNIPLADPIPDRQLAMTALISPLSLPQVPRSYDYDLVGNRELERASDGSTIDYQANQLDQYTTYDGTNYSYDANGNLTNDGKRVFIYDSVNRLVRVEQASGGEIVGFWHDALGRRIMERTSNGITQLICDTDDIIAEYRNGSLLAQYIFDDGIDRPLHMATEDQEHWYHADLVGSIRLLTDDNGAGVVQYRYRPFGAITEAVNADRFNPWRYTGHRFDVDLSSYDYRVREYDPEIGRFVQRDSAEMADGTNLYTYTNSNPLLMIDPLGTDSRPEVTVDGSDNQGSGWALFANASRPWNNSNIELVDFGVIEGPRIILNSRLDKSRYSGESIEKQGTYFLTPEDFKKVIQYYLPDNTKLTPFEEKLLNRDDTIRILLAKSGIVGYKISLTNEAYDYVSRTGELVEHEIVRGNAEAYYGITPFDVGSGIVTVGRAIGRKLITRQVTKRSAKRAHSLGAASADDYSRLGRVRRWAYRGSENDKFYLELSKAEKRLYSRGQRTFTDDFYEKYALETFTEGKVGKELVEGIVERGRFLKEHFPIRSIFHPLDLLNLRKTWRTGLDPSTRQLLRRLGIMKKN